MADLIRALGTLGLATRLKRLGDRLQRDASRLYGELEIDFESRWFALLYLLTKEPELSVTAAARRLGLSHPAIHQAAAGMAQRGLLIASRNRADDRSRLLRLTPKGREVAARLTPVWAAIAAQSQVLLDQVAPALLQDLDSIEDALDVEDMRQRVLGELQRRAAFRGVVRQGPAKAAAPRSSRPAASRPVRTRRGGSR
jgi:DNA-binding MarR family transcriptional regulator